MSSGRGGVVHGRNETLEAGLAIPSKEYDSKASRSMTAIIVTEIQGAPQKSRDVPWDNINGGLHAPVRAS